MAKLGEILELPTAGDRHKFSNFDVVSDHSDHHFARNQAAAPFQTSSSAVHKEIMKEWRILERDLPSTIFVRVYETRIDLLRAAIVGAAGTPYHDGLFFFDLVFPSDYPSRPPKVHYHSFGMRLNPNLYASGTVCLSLLNTWGARAKHERWGPTWSTVLQILVSIQALVLNEKPFYNEPGTTQVLSNKSSLRYNDTVFALSCKTMAFLLRRPPKNFEGLVAGHFLERAGEILRWCNYYMDGRARVGRRELGEVEVSGAFKNSLKMAYGELLVAFEKNGSSVRHIVEQIEQEKKLEEIEKSKLVAEGKGKGKGKKEKRMVWSGEKFNVGKIIGKIKEIFRLKTKKKKSKASI